jgi:hypothetical protein
MFSGTRAYETSQLTGQMQGRTDEGRSETPPDVTIDACIIKQLNVILMSTCLLGAPLIRAFGNETLPAFLCGRGG